MSIEIQGLIVGAFVVGAFAFLAREAQKRLRGFSAKGAKSCSACGCEQKPPSAAPNEKRA